MKSLIRRRKKEVSNTLKRKLITQLNPRSPISEQYRTIRTNIEFSAVDKQIRTIVVTSPSPSEGKSMTSANLAVVFSQQGKRVLLIDSDLRKPTVHYTFNETNTFGLTNVLSSQIELKKAIKSTNEANLDILTSGPIPPNPAELLSSNGMKNILKETQTEYDLVIFDTPPVLAVTDAQVLANQCDGTILVISSGKTETDPAVKAKELLETAQAKVLGVVLNNKKAGKNEHYYYYGTR